MIPCQKQILIADDDRGVATLLKTLVAHLHHAPTVALSVAEARALLRERSWDLIFSDIHFPDGNGLELLDELRLRDRDVPMVIMTAHATMETAVRALRAGASDYLLKPFQPEEIEWVISRVLTTRDLQRSNRTLRAELTQRSELMVDLGRSPEMKRLLSELQAAAASEATILLLGETGTGKTELARAAHAWSSRREGPFVAVDCGTIPEALVESELYGHERGAFTGADRARTGLFQEADGGTLFLDEVGELSPAMQVKLLKAIEEREIRPVGATHLVPLNVRFIAATHRELEGAVSRGEFREDLWYRLSGITMRVPPLRERKSDIPLLVEEFTRRFQIQNQKARQALSQESMQALLEYPWPGNIRELQNVIERWVVLGELSVPTSSQREPVDLKSAVQAAIERTEKDLIQRALAGSGFNRTHAAERLGISRRTLIDKIKLYSLE